MFAVCVTKGVAMRDELNGSEERPVDDDVLGPDGKVIVPDDVASAIRTLIRWAGDDPDARGAARHAAARRARVEGILRGL